MRNTVDGLEVNRSVSTRGLSGPYIIAVAMVLRNRLDGVTITSVSALPCLPRLPQRACLLRYTAPFRTTELRSSSSGGLLC